MGDSAPFTDEGLQNLPSNARCLQCGYALRGLTTSRCPECGRVFDAAQPTTYRTGSGLPHFLRGFCGPPRKWHTVLGGVLTAYWIIGQSDPLGPPGLFLPAACCVYYILLPLLFANFALRAIVTVLAPRNHDDEGASPQRWRWVWVTLPICTLLCVWVTFDNWPLAWRFHASHTAFQAEAMRLAALPPSSQAVRYELRSTQGWLGLYPIRRALVRRDTNGAVQSIDFRTGAFLFGSWGFRYDCTAPTIVVEPELPPGWSRWANMK